MTGTLLNGVVPGFGLEFLGSDTDAGALTALFKDGTTAFP